MDDPKIENSLKFVNLRTHHLVCLQSFIGKGYNDVFVANVFRILGYLKKYKDKKSIVVDNKVDVLCMYCPNNSGFKCNEELRIKILDEKFSTILQSSEGEIFSMQEITKKIANNLSEKDFSEICGNCCWVTICKNSLF